MKNNRFQIGLVCALIGLLSLACNRPESVVPQNPSDSPSEPTTEQALRVGRNGRYFTILPPITQQAIEKVIPDAEKLCVLVEQNTHYYYDPQSEEGKKLEASMAPDPEEQASARTQLLLIGFINVYNNNTGGDNIVAQYVRKYKECLF